MVPLDVPAHIMGRNHLVTLSTLAPLSSGGIFLRWRRRHDLHIVVIVVDLCIFDPIQRELVVVCYELERIPFDSLNKFSSSSSMV